MIKGMHPHALDSFATCRTKRALRLWALPDFPTSTAWANLTASS